MFDLDPQQEFLVGIDSDGCAFDTMEVKHKECFIPNIINSYELQGISKYAREAAEFVNLYSKSRGINRFPALIETMQWLDRRPEVRRRNVPRHDRRAGSCNGSRRKRSWATRRWPQRSKPAAIRTFGERSNGRKP